MTNQQNKVNPNRKVNEDTRTPEDLIGIIESQAEKIQEVLQALKNRGI